MRAVFPVILHYLIAMRARAAGDRFQSIDKITAGDCVDYQSDQQQGDDPHEKHDLLLFWALPFLTGWLKVKKSFAADFADCSEKSAQIREIRGKGFGVSR